MDNGATAMPKATGLPDAPAEGPHSEKDRETSLETVLYDKPGYLIRRLQQTAISIFVTETERFDITPLQYGVLVTARAFPGVDQAGASNSLGLDRTTTMGIVDRLERKGLLVRRPAPHDRRVKQLFLTDEGGQRLVELKAAVDRAQKRMLEPLTRGERVFFTECLVRIVSHHNAASRTPVSDEGIRQMAASVKG
jgi:DNA-binding MarR family transcriptional regulator